MNTLKNIDCLKLLKGLKDNSVDLVLLDPPYFGIVKDKWDNQWATERDYLDWCAEWTKECYRVLKPDRMFVVWGTLKTNTFLKYALEAPVSLVRQEEIVWSYNWGGRTKKNFARKHEYAFCWSKGDSFLFNADDVRVERKVKKNLRTGLPYTKGTIPTCVWEKNNHTGSKDACNWHSTTKNIDILERIIKAYTNKGDLILDCFSGSGSTMIAAKRTGRSFIGSEIDKAYYIKSKERLTNE